MNYKDIPNIINTSSNIQMEYVDNNVAIQNSINNILMTSPGTMPGHPEFGCGIGKFLFELIDPLISKLIEEEISYAIVRWEPRIKISEITVIDDQDYNRLVAKISYFIVRDPNNIEREYIFQAKRN